jgi:tetratricopeptide (TPR) repeat protein
MESDLAHKAICAALAGNWKEATNLNKEILKTQSNDIDALNRLARAYAELGNISAAKKHAEKVLKLDPFNPIATKSLNKWKALKHGEVHSCSAYCPQIFLEEPGKTKIVPLLHLGECTTLGKLDSGDEVQLDPHGHRVSVISLEGKYIGRLTDDLSARLRRFISLGNEYQVFIKTIEPESVKIFIREVKSSPKLAGTPSFPAEKIEYISFTPPELVHKKVETTTSSEEE